MQSIKISETKQYMTISEVAAYLGIDYFHAYKLLNEDNTMSYLKYGRKKVWLFTDIENFILKHLVTPDKKKENKDEG